jgi:creatinine amidohydrolase
MRYEDLNWFDIERYLEGDNRILLVLGSCEQHGYLSLTTDVKIPSAIADAASQTTGVLIAPPLTFGCSPYFLDYPGTISLRIETLNNIVEDIVYSIYKQGFRRLLILNGHGGNDPVRARLYELINELPGLQISWYSWWNSHSVQLVAEEYELKPAHANWLESFPFTQVSELPVEEKIPVPIPGLLNSREARKLFGDGSFGGPYQANHEIMDRIFQEVLKDVLHLLNFD